MMQEKADRDAFHLVGIEAIASNADPRPIGAIWGESATLAGRTPGALDGDLWAVYCDYEGDHTRPYTFFLGMRVAADAPTPSDSVRRTVPAGTFARFAAHGEQPGALIAAWQAIWTLPLERTYVADYERHPAEDRSKVEIFVGVR